jgi:hypothetical protein
VRANDDFCSICYIEALPAAPVALLSCGHAFHSHCLQSRVEQGHSGARITFAHIFCPLCNARIKAADVPWMSKALVRWEKLYDTVEAKALQRLRYEGREKEVNKNARFRGNPAGYAMDLYSYYTCSKCQGPYFAGLAECRGADEEELRILICSSCSGERKLDQVCSKHGSEFIQWKCR